MFLTAVVLLVLLVRVPIFERVLTGLVHFITTEALKDLPDFIRIVGVSLGAYGIVGGVAFIIGAALALAARFGGNTRLWPVVIVAWMVSSIITFPAISRGPEAAMQWFRELSGLVSPAAAVLGYFVASLVGSFNGTARVMRQPIEGSAA